MHSVLQKIALSMALVLSVFVPTVAHAAVGCTLSNPARDLKALYPEMTSYREDLREFAKYPNGKDLYEGIKDRLGSELDPVYEAFETPYTLYSVFKDNEKIGYVHGVNVPGLGGVIQIFLAVDPETGSIVKMVFQRLESPGAKMLRAKQAREQFLGLSLADFYKHDYFAKADSANSADKLAAIKPPAGLPESVMPDWQATLRGLRKNLILLDIFAFNRKFEPFYERSKAAQQSISKEKP